ncbi:chlororespiratory reduction protein 7 [Lyngbya confervoides]|uniref:Chlororespiratory reduction protein 7 n=1 Tax=Lyngbya confervoides BDU141951 TaxID=1574623 RepID=A0ABD4TAR3_9CYAN|nr:chlororespiratory reduction protein 7 [Lyngbya confervoides]MCM1985242.1 chlororespiratory reduction protein 7 [Lyngbya confervoides BDU141951]
MPSSLMYDDEEMFVVLETNQPEVFLSADELRQKLTQILASRQEDLPRDLQAIPAIAEQVTHLLETSCELDIGPDGYLQWYVVRTDK